MALKRYQETFGSVQAGGDVFVLAGASVEVRDEASGALAAIFEDRAGNTAKANPFTADSNGYGFFYAADGRYRVTATLSGETVDVRDVLLGVVFQGENLTVNIPTDYSTIQAAIDDLSIVPVKQGVIIDVVIESGHSLTSGVLVENGDYSHFRISSIDATVTLDASFPSDDVVVHGINAAMPEMAFLVDAGTKGRGGYWAVNNSRGIVADGAGVKNVGDSGTETPKGVGCFVLENSKVNGSGTDGGSGCIFTGAALRNVWVSKNSDFQGESGNFDGCLGDHGVFVSRESRAHLSLASVSSCSGNGLEMYRSYVTAPGAKFNSNGGHGAGVDQGSRLSAPERNSIVTEFDGNGGGGIFARCSRVYVPRVQVIGNTGMGVQGIQVSAIDLEGATVQNSTTNNVRGEDGTTINIANGESTGSGVDDLSIARGSYIVAEGCTTTTSVGTPALADCNIGVGFNAIAGSNGIIWD